MKSKIQLFGLVFFTAISLIVASLTEKDNVEKAFADDYDTYVHSAFSSTSLYSTYNGNHFPVLLFNAGRAEFDILTENLRFEILRSKKLPHSCSTKIFLLQCSLLL
jgi:hypothetical protein